MDFGQPSAASGAAGWMMMLPPAAFWFSAGVPMIGAEGQLDGFTGMQVTVNGTSADL